MLDITDVRATITSDESAIVTGLHPSDYAITTVGLADRRRSKALVAGLYLAELVAAITWDEVAVITALSRFKATIPALEEADRITAISIDEVPIIALFWRLNDTVAAGLDREDAEADRGVLVIEEKSETVCPARIARA